MKFGKILLKSQFPEWSGNYISYKALKKIIKRANSQYETALDDFVIAFFYRLDREVEKVNSFFLYKRSQTQRRLRLLSEKYRFFHSNEQNGSSMKCSELENRAIYYSETDEELLSVLSEIREEINKLFGFARLNKKGFDKILKKFDKKLGEEAKGSYLSTKVNVQPFASCSMLDEMLDTIDQWIAGSGKVHSALGSQLESNIRLSEEHNNMILCSIEKDNTESLQKLINKITTETSVPVKRILTLMLYKASSYRALSCIGYLLKIGASLIDDEELNQRSLIHKLAIYGRFLPKGKNSIESLTSDKEHSLLSLDQRENDIDKPSNISEADDPEIINYILNNLSSTGYNQVSTPDVFGRLPLHYAAMNGFSKIARSLLLCMKKAELTNFDDPIWLDNDGYTPLFYAVSRGHTQVVEDIIKICQIKNVDIYENATSPNLLPGIINAPTIPSVETAQQLYYVSYNTFSHSHTLTPLALACKLGYTEIAKLLLSYDANPDMQDEEGDTPLHLAARNGHSDCARVLLGLDDPGQLRPKANTEIKENFYGWTPLFLAAVDGHIETVKILVQAGADANVVDFCGWTPHMHAIFRGHISVKNILRPLTSPYKLEDLVPTPTNDDVRPSIIAYGHKYLQDQSLIFISLGSTDSRKSVIPVQLHDMKPSASASLVVYTNSAISEPAIIDIPFRDNLEVDPIVLNIPNDIENMTLSFDVLPIFGTKRQLIGRAVFMLSSLMGSVTIPILSARDLCVIGQISFEFFVVRPFKHQNLALRSRNTYWKSVTTQVIGHRGMGANSVESSGSQPCENTIMSFITAASLGAEYIEFDVQSTSEHIPVIYHDWTMSETGYNIPVHSVTLEQFKKLKKSNDVKFKDIFAQDRNIRDEFRNSLCNPNIGGLRLKRSSSEGSITSLPKSQPSTRDEDVVTIQVPFPTLAEAFEKVPVNIGFNIEVKYPMVDEAEADGLPAFGDINLFLDAILRCTYDHAHDRKILFSSFHPNVCLGLSFKQPNYPVFFLTDCGFSPMADVRCNSLQQAIRFARLSNLLGVVTNVEPIIEAPQLVRSAREAGLLLFTYGTSNNEVLNVQLQRRAGVDAVIVDSVLAVRRGLQQNELGI